MNTKRQTSPSKSQTPAKKSRIDTLFDSQASEDEVENLGIGQHSPHLLFQQDDDNEEEEDDDDGLFNSSAPIRRSLYSELLMSSNIDHDEDLESKTTLPLSRSYARPIPEDEVDVFFSSHNPANEPEFVLSSALKYSLLQQEHRLGPAWVTSTPHFLTPEYFENYTVQDREIPAPESTYSSSVSLFDTQFTVLGNLGSGEFAEVWKVSCENQEYAIKKAKVNFTGWEDRWLKIIEVHHLRKVSNSKYCVRLVDAWEEQACLYIQLELCSNGSLDDYINEKKGKIDKDVVWNIFHEIVLGVKDIHDANLVHLDLKPSNILIHESGCMKIGDFGISATTPVDLRFLKGEGDRRYMAPDLLREEFDKPADIFSLGLILLELATGIVLPGKGESWEMLRVGDFSKQKAALSKLPSEMSEMIEWLLSTRAKDRPTVDDIMEHPTFNIKYKEYALSNYTPPIKPNLFDQLKHQDSFSTVEEVF